MRPRTAMLRFLTLWLVLRPAAVLAPAVVLAALSTALPTALEAQFRIHPSSPNGSGTEARVRVVPDRPVALMLSRAEGSPTTVDILLTPFADSLGNVVDVTASLPEAEAGEVGAEPGRSLAGVPFPGAARTVLLHFPPLPTPAAFVGELILGAGAAEAGRFRIEARQPPVKGPATLVVDHTGEVELDLVAPVFGQGRGRFHVVLRERSGTWPIQGVVARVSTPATGPSTGSMDPLSDIFFTAGSDTTRLDLWSQADPADDVRRSIPPGGILTLTGHVRVPGPGEYTTAIRFSSTNSLDDEAQVVTLRVRARHPLWAILLVLFGGIVLSVVVTKVLSVRRQQLRYRRTLSRVKTEWLRDEPAKRAVIQVQAMISRARDLARGIRLTWEDWLAEPLELERKRLERLQRVSRIRREIDGWSPYGMVRRRARKELRGVMEILSGAVDDQVLQRADEALGELEGWSDPDKLDDLYGRGLEDDIAHILDRVEPDELGGEARKRVRELVTALKKSPPSQLEAMVEREKDYARLKVLWEWRRDARILDELVDLSRLGSMDPLFDRADEEAWERLGELKMIVARTARHGTVEAFEPLTFEVVPTDPSRGDNYLFKHNLEFHWDITLHPRRRLWWLWGWLPGTKKWKYEKEVRLSPVSTQPHVVQYAPRPGRLTSGVEVVFDGDDRRKVDGPELQVTPSGMMRLRNAFSLVEWGTAGVALVAAVVSGLLMFYVDEPVFGAPKDYLVVFLWALAVDQGKNFLQINEALGGVRSEEG